MGSCFGKQKKPQQIQKQAFVGQISNFISHLESGVFVWKGKVQYVCDSCGGAAGLVTRLIAGVLADNGAPTLRLTVLPRPGAKTIKEMLS